jgi:hypothetical protein
MPPQHSYEVQPPTGVDQEISSQGLNVDKLVREAIGYLEDGNADVDDLALARMFIERGHSEELAYWLVREAEVRRAPR